MKNPKKLMFLLIPILLVVVFLAINAMIRNQDKVYVRLRINTFVGFSGYANDPNAPSGPANPFAGIGPQNMSRGDEVVFDNRGVEGRIRIIYISDDYVAIQIRGGHLTSQHTPISTSRQTFNVYYETDFRLFGVDAIGFSEGWILNFTRE
ncbi:MAG: hypothetical protein FWC69_02990 [Defluviitaleaceae bacterium]|nr:hypothetical protein [Defluviitaleaceae bacterium]